MNRKLTIRKLMPADETAFLEAYEACKSIDDFDFVSHFKEGMPFKDLISILDDQEIGIDLPKGFVPSTFLFAFVGTKLVGRVMIRHQLNEFLKTIGGHIGYGVVPSERGKGYASQMLQYSLESAKTLNLFEVLITCDEDNLPSKKIIENACGVFQSLSSQGPNFPRKRIYSISL